MKKIAILGFNIFSPGGTSRSNINLLEEFGRAGYTITFYNFRPFTHGDLRKLQKREPAAANVAFKFIKELENDPLDYEYFFITRENFFCVAPYIRANSQAKVVGEIHTPLAMIEEEDLASYLRYFTCVRVATASIKAEVERRFGCHNVYVQTVSLEHIDVTPQPFDPSLVDSEGHINLAIRSRFDHEKDIPAAIKLIDYLVNYLKHDEYHMYITGYGPSGTLYHNLTKYYQLEDHIHFNEKVVPERHLYISTSFYETLGYSVLEEFAAGHPVLLFPGNDGVVKENFGAFADCVWLTKVPEDDVPNIFDFVAKPRTEEAYRHNLALIAEMKAGYVEKFEQNTAAFAAGSQSVAPASYSYDEMWTALQKRTKFDGMRRFRRFYYKLRRIPAFGALIKQDWIRVPAMHFLSRFVGETPDFTSQEPISDNKYFIESFHGTNISGDPKYFGLAIKRRHPDAEVYVSSRNQLVDMEAIANGFTPVRVGSLRYLEKFQQSKYVFMNGNTLDKAGKRDGQVFVQTWHGFPMKQMVNDLADPEQRENESTAFAPRMQKWDYLTTSSEYNVELLRSAFRLADNDHLTVFHNGTPKNEYLLANGDSEAEKQRVFEKYFNRPYDGKHKIVLFCPTWRKGNRSDVSELELKAVVDALPEEYLIVVKLHPLEGRLRKQYAELDPRIFCFYNELVDIQELYVLSDLLISDYSSAIFDYALLNKPILVMQEDEEDYQQSIGWYFDIESETGLHARSYTAPELTTAILNAPDTREASAQIKTKLLTEEHVGSTDEVLDAIGAAKA
ncbi:CDP-glycerol glycerophosphotransferase family protein [Lacticaseibacillus kribbianus]|uniref:CDP-glycerol glycerophosphotransferase family protein n=1 Tax=Lacticaseibacillus kribbianus TaxID=2926292 RepID=UPI001CD22395|nr:CDP-glycerol glycerophosphotransferase family protein [Lacticaseibacillus kribbianus]